MTVPLMSDPCFWQQYAEHYEKLFTLLPLRESYHDMLGCAEITDDTRVLDLGCGTGFLARMLQMRGQHPTLVGLDGSPEMLERARAVPYGSSASYHQVDLNQKCGTWGLGSAQFDAIFFVNSLYALKNPPAALRCAALVAADDAHLTVSLPRPSAEPFRIMKDHLELFAQQGGDIEKELGEVVERFQMISVFNKVIIGSSENHFPTAAELHDWFEGSGWSILAITPTYADQNWLVVAERTPRR